MDIFSLGCILLELFLNGEPAMDLGDLIEYRQSGGNVAKHSSLPQKLNRIESSSMRAACRHMLHLDPNKRLTAGEYLKRLMSASSLPQKGVSSSSSSSGSGTRSSSRDTNSGGGGGTSTTATTTDVTTTTKTPPPIPSCHETVLYPFLARVRCEVLSPDARIALAAVAYGKVLRATVGVDDEWGEAYFRALVEPTMLQLEMEVEADYYVGTAVAAAAAAATTTGGISVGGRDAVEKGHGSTKEKADDSERYSISADGNNPESSIVKFPSYGYNGDWCSNDDTNHQLLLAETEKLLRAIEMNTILSDDCSNDDGGCFGGGEGKEETISSSDTITNANPTLPTKQTYTSAPSTFRNLKPPPSSGALIIFVQFILSTIRHTQRPSSKRIALQLLLRLSKFSTDEVRLQRIVPTVISILHDTDACVRTVAIRALAEVLASIENFPPSDAQVFPQYILKRVSHLITDTALGVRVAFTECIALLAETALRFLDTCHAIKLYETVDNGGVDGLGGGGGNGDEEDHSAKVIKNTMKSVGSAFGDSMAADLLGSPIRTPKETGKKNKVKDQSHDTYVTSATTLIQNEYDKDLSDLHETIARWVVSITTDTSDRSSALKHALLKDITRLCNFFGQDGVMACILPQVLAFLNHRKDWQLRASLCEHLPSICAIVGRAATEQFVVPCVETALIDEQELVISSALQCLASLVEMGLLTRATLLGSPPMKKNRSKSMQTTTKGRNIGIVQKYSPLLVYPSGDVRQAAAFLVASCCRSIGFPDDEALLIPLIRPFLRFDVTGNRLKTIEGVKSCLMPPLTKQELELELTKPQWTAIGMGDQRNRQEVISAEAEKLLALVRSYHSDERYFEGYVENLEGYLVLLRRTLKHNYDIGEKNKSLRIIKDNIEGINKAAISYYLPNQKYAELLTKPLPTWYDQMRQVASSDPLLESEFSSLRTTTSLSKVFGLTIVLPTNSAEPQCRWKGDIKSDTLFDPSVLAEKEGMAKEKALQSYLCSPKSRAFGAATNGEWGALSLMDPALAQISRHVSKVVSLDIPPIPPRLGVLRDSSGRSYSSHAIVASPHDSETEAARRAEWRPKVDALTCSSPAYEHSGPITKLAVSQDQAFFVSASHDGTCKVWETRQVEDSAGDLQSCLAYGGQNRCGSEASRVRINDVSIIENSHSVASGGSDGSVHVWRVDTISNNPQPAAIHGSPMTSSGSPRVSGCTLLRKVEPNEGEILAVSHFNTPGASIVAFATQRGFIHSWDLRCAKEPFALCMKPELGHLSSMAVGNDRNWLVAGTSRGFLTLWDIRFQKMVKLWQHSSGAPMNRLGTSLATLSGDSEPKPYVVMGCGQNEVSVFDIMESSCRHCFRVLDPALSYLEQATLPQQCTSMPVMAEVTIQSEFKRRIHGINDAVKGMINENLYPPEPSIQSMTGRIGTTGRNYLITGSNTGCILFWDFSSASKCYTISGLMNKDRPVYENVDNNSHSGSLYLCRPRPNPPKRMQYGAVRPENRHRDAILDIKKIETPMKGLLSCSRDGIIKFWR